MSGRIRFTAKVRRGLRLIREIVVYAQDDTKPPTLTLVSRWKGKQRADYEAALTWLEQIERDDAAKAGGDVRLSKASTVQREVIEAFTKPEVTVAELSARLGRSFASVRMALRMLQRGGLVEPVNAYATVWRRKVSDAA